jgi:hypothetical protein
VINGTAQSASFTPTHVGTYRWIATYVGDVNNVSVRGACGAAGEIATVARTTPTLVTEASAGVVAGQGELDDHATVTGLVDPAGAETVTFRLYGPSDVACSEAPIFTSTVPLTNGAAQSATFTPITPGTYRWIATYDSDVNNAPASGTCNDPTETRTVTSPPPVLPHTGSAPKDELIAAWDVVALGLVLLASTRRKRA